MNSAFPHFEYEIKEHNARGFHKTFGPLDKDSISKWFASRGWSVPEGYLRFYSEIGPGIFFGGSFVIYPLESGLAKTVESETQKTIEIKSGGMFVFGYDGTTEGCYCMEAKTRSEKVFWFSFEEKMAQVIASDFSQWIESQPSDLFKESSYAGYKNIKDIQPLMEVFNERSRFKVRLLDYDKRLVKAPDRLSDQLPRYNKLTLEIQKMEPSELAMLTIKVLRLGSKVGNDNIEYVTIPVSDIGTGSVVRRECYVFDPFNLLFSDLKIEFNPVIDLGSKMRVKFKEIKDLIK